MAVAKVLQVPLRPLSGTAPAGRVRGRCRPAACEVRIRLAANSWRLVVRDESNRTHVYAAAVQLEATQQRLIVDLVERAFGGSTHQLVLQALSPYVSSLDELARIRAMLDELSTVPSSGA